MKKLYHQLFTIIFVVCFGLTGLVSFGQSIDPEVTVIQPSIEGISWVIGTNHLISWKDNFVKPVDIYLIDDFLGTASRTVTLIKGNVTGSTYNWNTNTAGVVAGRGDYKIRVQSHVDTTYFDESDEYFSIVTGLPGTYKIDQPNVPGIAWVQGNTYLISWEAGANEKVKIELLINGTATTTTSIGLPAGYVSGTTRSWHIPSDFPNGNNIYKIRITGEFTGGVAESEAPFSIIATPGGDINVIQPSLANIEWKKGTTHLISWKDEIPEKVNIDLISGTASPTVVINHLKTGASGSTWSWPITDDPGTYRIRISSSLDTNNFAVSEYTFEIVEHLTGHFDEIFQPKDGDTWLKGTNHLISWEDEVEEKVNIDWFSYDDGTATPTVAPVASGNIGINVSGSTKSWNNVSPLGNFFKIRISCPSNPDVTPIFSEGYFKIVNTLGGLFNQFFQPLGGENWLKNTTYLISWEDDILEGVDIWITDNTGDTSTFTKIKTNVIGSTWLFNTGNKEYGNYRFKLTSNLDSGAEIVSNIFHIVPSIGGGISAINQPNESGLVWIQGTSNLISWDDDLTEKVRIKLHYYGTVSGTVTPTISYPSLPGAPSSASVSGTTFNWNIPAGQTPGYYRVEVTSTLDSTNNKLAENEFRIMQLIDAQVYPNPCTENMNIEIDNCASQVFNIELFDRFGTRVIKRNLNTSNSDQISIPVSNLPNGVYFLNMTAGDTRISKKVIVQH